MDDVNTAFFRLVIDIATAVGVLVSIVYTWVTSRDKANKRAIEQVESEVQQMQSDVAKMKGRISNLPDHDDIASVHRRIDDIAVTLSELKGQAAQDSKQLTLIHNYLLGKADKG